jgi:hemoglobin/transferrin/lactoferrin receptor protein
MRSRVHALLLGVSSIGLFASGALAQQQQTSFTLDPITVLATKTPESIWDSLSATSAVTQEDINRIQPRRVEDILIGIPGVWFQQRSDSPESSISIRGMQNFGRVAVLIDGARQNFQRTGHGADGTFLIDPELLAGVDVVRGPVANIYGSGAIGGVASFRTKDVDDILRPGQVWGTQLHTLFGSNSGQALGSAFGAARIGPNVDVVVGGSARTSNDYKDGDGNTVDNTGYDLQSGLAKITVRPADGHQVKLTGITQHTDFVTGQGNFGESVFDSKIENDIVAARWTYGRPDDRLFNFDANVYWTKTATEQTKISGTPPPIGIGAIGDMRNFTIKTTGADINNTSRFDLGPIRNALTFGIDGFEDKVDTSGFGVVFTPSGKRTVTGGFAQWKANYSTWLEVIGGLRYDRYELNGGGLNTEGDRVSPKITVGITPFPGITPYVTYAEGYRAPAVTETLVSGIHPVLFAPFLFLPNPTLTPETGKTAEAGLNLKYNDIFSKGDAFRAKFAVFRNNVDDYIEQIVIPNGFVGAGGIPCVNPNPFLPICIQYQNLPGATLEGAEFEAVYDAGRWFTQIAASHVRGQEEGTNIPLGTVPPDKVVVTFGMRFLDNKLTTAVRWVGVASKDAGDIPDRDFDGVPDFTPSSGYGVVNLYAGYEFNRDVTVSFAVENLFDKQYVPYLNAAANTTLPMPGITVKGGVQIRFGDDFFKRG